MEYEDYEDYVAAAVMEILGCDDATATATIEADDAFVYGEYEVQWAEGYYDTAYVAEQLVERVNR